MLSKQVFQDKELIDEIIQRFSTDKKWINKLKEFDIKPEKLTNKIQEVYERKGEAPTGLFESYEEAIVLLAARPAILIRNNTFEISESDTWKQKLEAYRSNIERAILSVGRIELDNHPSHEWEGTGWIIDDDIIVTNRHVARAFATKEVDKFTFLTEPDGKPIKPLIDFGEEYKTSLEMEFKGEILYIAEDKEPDIAFLRVRTTSTDGEKLPAKIPLSMEELQSGSDVVAIGYPAEDGFRNDPKAMKEIFGDIYDVKRLQPGKISRLDEQFFLHDCSTLGGNSGSIILDLQKGTAVGLHYEGKYKKGNYAIPAKILLEYLDKLR